MNNDITDDISKAYNVDSNEASSAWEFAKEQAKNTYQDSDEAYYPYAISLAKQLMQKNVAPSGLPTAEKPSLFTDPAETNKQSMFSTPPPNSNMAPKVNEMIDISDKNERNPKYKAHEIVFSFIDEMREKGITDTEIVMSLCARMGKTQPESEMILQTYNLLNRKTSDSHVTNIALSVDTVIDSFLNADIETFAPYAENTKELNEKKKLHEIKDLDFFDWKAKSTNLMASVRFLILDKTYQMDFDYTTDSGVKWNQNWNMLKKQGITTLVNVSIDQLNGDYNAQKLSANKSNLSMENKEALSKVMLLAFTEYFQKFNSAKDVQYIIFTAGSQARALFLNEFVPKFCKKFPKYALVEEVSIELSTPQIKIFACRNGSVKLKETSPIEEDDGAGMGNGFGTTASSNFGDAIPSDGERNRDKWKADWDSQGKNKRIVDVSAID